MKKFLLNSIIWSFIGMTLFANGEVAAVEAKFNEVTSYNNVSSSSLYLKFNIYLENKDDNFVLVVENTVLAYKLAGAYIDKGIFSDRRTILPSNFDNFISQVYIPFLEKYENQNSLINLKDFPVNETAKKRLSGEDIKNGFIIAQNRQGQTQQFGLLGISIGIVRLEQGNQPVSAKR